MRANRVLGRGARRYGDVSTPLGSKMNLGARYDPETFGRFSEAIARYFGTARFLGIQSAIVAIWIALNSVAFVDHWDPYPFILLNLLFSTQAAYAAPLILLAQNRQDQRDRLNIERDREVAARTQADAEFLARELAAVRLALAGMATADELNTLFEKLQGLVGASSAVPSPGSLHRAGGSMPAGASAAPGPAMPAAPSAPATPPPGTPPPAQP